jgi:hypothetical protein
MALAVFGLFARTLRAAPPIWIIQTASAPAGPWTNAVSGTSSQMFARLVLSNAPASTVAIGGVMTVADATGVLSNGVGYATIVLSTNDWSAMMGSSGIHSNLWEVTITHQ